MTVLARPSFWPEPRDPSAWQRALRTLGDLPVVPDPWPCWERHLRTVLPRRSVPGLYGRKGAGPLLGVSLVTFSPSGWEVAAAARPLIGLPRDAFHEALARWLEVESAWLRTALRRLSGDEAHLAPPDLAPLRSPLYLLRSLGWLDDALRPRLPTDLAVGLSPATPASVLRAATATHADPSGFVSIDEAARALWTGLFGGPAPRSLAQWSDAVFGAAIASGTLEVHAWSPGQPRHGRGLKGDRDRKRARWTVHDDFAIAVVPKAPTEDAA